MGQTILLIIMGLLVIALIVTGTLWLWNEYQLRMVLPKQIERNTSVFNFRMYVLLGHPKLYDKLPSYDEMMIDGKELCISSYIK